MNRMVKVSLDHAGALLDRIKIYEIIIQSLLHREGFPKLSVLQ